MNTPPSGDRQTYTAADITVMTGLEAVRKRPAMYLGVPCGPGIPVAVAVSLVMDLRTADMFQAVPTPLRVRVDRLADDRLRVSDNALGIPPHLLRPSATRLFVPHAPTRRNLAVATALCAQVVVDVSIRPAGTWQRGFQGDNGVGPLIEVDPDSSDHDGTAIACTFDPVLLESDPSQWWEDWQQRICDEVVCVPGRPWHYSCEASCWAEDAELVLHDVATSATLRSPLR